MLVAVVVLTVVAPRCAPPPEQTWWQRTVAYQVYVRSFYDTDGNGIGDLNGRGVRVCGVEDGMEDGRGMDGYVRRDRREGVRSTEGEREIDI